jgi:inhibitor of cysteine peptidase
VLSLRTASIAALAAATLAAPALAGCGSKDEPEPDELPAAPLRVTDLNRPVEVQVGDRFEIPLAANPTTGYSWVPTDTRPRQRIVSYEGSDYVPEPGTKDQVGAGGEQVLRFEATGNGRTTIELVYRLPNAAEQTANKRQARKRRQQQQRQRQQQRNRTERESVDVVVR